MKSTDADLPVRSYRGADGLALAFREMGEGRPLILLHGLFSNAYTNWIRYGHAGNLAEAGFRVIMPDLRAHGCSAAPHDPSAYPPDILAADGLALIAHLGLGDEDYALGGYSLGARTTARMLVNGARPRRAILSGMGLAGMRDTEQRAKFFRHVLRDYGLHERGSAAWMAEAFLKINGGDRLALLPLLDSFVDTADAELAAIPVETLVLCGIDDHDNGSADALAGMLLHGHHVTVPGNHMTAVVNPALGRAMVDFLVA